MKGRQMPAMGAATHAGQIRELNEDAIGTPEVMGVPAERRARKGELLVVADGMGGHAAGEVASQQATHTVFEEYYNDPSADLSASLRRAVEVANSRIHAEASADLSKHGMGTTLVAAVIQGSRLIVANVGDSRAYLVRRGQIRQISRDHSWVAESVAAGLISEDQARHHPQRSLVLRALGQKPRVEVDIFSAKLRPGDAVVLCSDGLSNEVADGEIAQVAGEGSAQEGADGLVALANGRLGRDNISAVVARIPPRYQQAVALPVALLGVVALAAIVAVAIVLIRPWLGTMGTGGTADATAVEVAATGAVASAPGWTTSPLPTPVPEWTPLATPAPATVAAAAPTVLPTEASDLTPAATPAARSLLATELICHNARMEMKLGWGCALVDPCATNGDALQGLYELLGCGTECCDGADLDPSADLDQGLPVSCSKPEAMLECWQGTVRPYPKMGHSWHLRGWFRLDTGGTHPVTVVPHWPPLDLDQPSEGSQVTVCGTQSGRAAIRAHFVLQWTPEDSCRLWLSPPVTEDSFWLAGSGTEMRELLRLSEYDFGDARVLVYSEWGPRGPETACGFRPSLIDDGEQAIFTCDEPGYLYTLEGGQ